MKNLLSTKEVAQFLDVNEKMIYTLVAEKGLPATKITGKWLFPQHLVEQWIETNTINYPEPRIVLPPYHGLLILTGSNDLLLERAISLFNTLYPEHIAVFGNLGSMGGLRALRQNFCHMASSHLLQEDEEEYNFDFASKELDRMPVVVNFCRREQGILIKKGNPKRLRRFDDIAKPGIRIVNRPLGTGTRLLFDRELKKAGIRGKEIDGYQREFHRHIVWASRFCPTVLMLALESGRLLPSLVWSLFLFAGSVMISLLRRRGSLIRGCSFFWAFFMKRLFMSWQKSLMVMM